MTTTPSPSGNPTPARTPADPNSSKQPGTDAQLLDVSLLTDATKCPNCGQALKSQTCRCGIDLAGPSAAHLWRLSQEAWNLIQRRTEQLARMGGNTAPPPTLDRAVLTDPKRCPNCGTPLPGTGCGSCGTRLDGPAGKDLWQLSSSLADLLTQRDRYLETLTRRVATPPLAPPTSGSPTTNHTAPPAPSPTTSPSPFLVPAATKEASPRIGQPDKHSRWSVQNVLLILGAVLLAGASVAFLSFSWGQMGILPRTLTIGLLTLIVFIAAGLCSWRGLRSSAEAISALGAVMFYLDLAALRSADLIVIGTPADHLALMNFGGGVLLVAAGVAMGLRAPRAIGTVLIPLGILSLAYGRDHHYQTALILVLGAGSALFTFHPLADKLTKYALAISSGIMLLAAFPAAVAALFTDGPLHVALVALCAAVLFGILTYLTRGGSRDVLGCATAALSALAFLLAGFRLSIATSTTNALEPILHNGVLAWPVLGLIIAALLVALVNKIRRDPGVPVLGNGATATGVITIVCALIPLLLIQAPVLVNDLLTGDDLYPVNTPQLLPAIGAVALGMLGLRALGVFPRLSGPAASTAIVTVVVVAPVLAPAGPIPLILWGTTSIISAISIAVLGRSPALRIQLRFLTWLPLAPALTFTFAARAGIGPAHLDADTGTYLTGIVLLITGVLLFVSRYWDVRRRNRTRTYGPSDGAPEYIHGKLPTRARTLLLTGSIVFLTWGLITLLIPFSGTYIGSAFSVTLALAVSALATSWLPVSRSRSPHPTVQALLLAAGVQYVVLTPQLLGVFHAEPQWVTVLQVTLMLVVLAQLTLFSFTTGRGSNPSRQTSTVLLPLALLTFVYVLSGFDTANRFEWPLVAFGALCILPGLLGFVLPDDALRRILLESTVCTLLLLVLTLTMRTPTVIGIAFLIVAAGALLLALTKDRSGYLWVGTCLTILGVLCLLLGNSFDIFELYTAPVALLVCAIGLRHHARERSGWVLVLGVTILLLPTAVLADDQVVWRSIALAVAIALVAALVLTLSRRGTGEPTFALARNLGLLAVVLTLMGPARLAALPIIRGTDPAVVILWLVVTALLTLFTCLALDSEHLWGPQSGPRIWASALIALPPTLVGTLAVMNATVTEVVAGFIAIGSIVIWGLIAVQGTPPGFPPVNSRQEFAARSIAPLVVAVLLAATMSAHTEFPPDALLTLSGVFVAYVGVRAAITHTDQSTWVSLPLGVLLTVGPASVVMLTEPTGWRVAFAVLAAAAWLLFGLRAGWQVPVTLGMLSLLAQVLVLAGPPALAAFSGLQGWAVLAIAGVLLLGCGLLYESQAKRARTVIRRFSDLR